MFWRRFAKRTNKPPEQSEEEQRRRAALKARVMEIFRSNPNNQYTLRHLEQKLAPTSLASLSLVLAELQEEGAVDRIIRVESPENHGGIGDYSSIEDVPDQVYDWRTQQTVDVLPSNTALLFKAHVTSQLNTANA